MPPLDWNPSQSTALCIAWLKTAPSPQDERMSSMAAIIVAAIAVAPKGE